MESFKMKRISLYKHLKDDQSNAYRNVVSALINTLTQLQSIPRMEEEDRRINLIVNSAIVYYGTKLSKKLKIKK